MKKEIPEADKKADDSADKSKSKKAGDTGGNAYAEGSDIHIAPGQEETLPHEGTHQVAKK